MFLQDQTVKQHPKQPSVKVKQTDEQQKQLVTSTSSPRPLSDRIKAQVCCHLLRSLVPWRNGEGASLWMKKREKDVFVEVFLCLLFPGQSEFKTRLKYLQRLDATTTWSLVRPDLHFVYVLVHINTYTHVLSRRRKDQHSHFLRLRWLNKYLFVFF